MPNPPDFGFRLGDPDFSSVWGNLFGSTPLKWRRKGRGFHRLHQSFKNEGAQEGKCQSRSLGFQIFSHPPVSPILTASISRTPLLPSNITTNQDAIRPGCWAHPSLGLAARSMCIASFHWLTATCMEMRITRDSAGSPPGGPVA